MFFVARDQVVNELERQPELRDLDVDLDSIVGALVAVMLVLTVWSLVAAVLGVFVLRRSNVARILLVISSAVVAVGRSCRSSAASAPCGSSRRCW